MSERRTRSGRVVEIAEGVAAAVRRRQREREPRVAVYGSSGVAHTVPPSAAGYDELLELGDSILRLTGEWSREPRPRSSPRSGTDGQASEPAA